LGYLPTNASRRQQTLERKRAEYKEAIRQHYNIDDDSRTLQEQETLRQVLVDVPRTAPEVPLFRNEKIKRCLARLLYIWAMRHPASSYVQGINDLATPLFAVFLADDYEGEDVQDGSVMVVLSEERLDEVSGTCRTGERGMNNTAFFGTSLDSFIRRFRWRRMCTGA
jgi:TBC1 domain family member 2